MESCLEPRDTAEFSALHCRDRWLALQLVREAAGVAGVLFVLGPDAQFSRGSEVAFNWLLRGGSGRSLLAAPVESRFEECVVFVSAARSVVFCKSEQHAEVAAKTAMWESCEVVVTSTEEEADQDSYDARKTQIFLDMVSGCTSLGVALRSDDQQADLKMSVERWPLVQAHAYDEFGLGFLTLRTSLVNIEAQLQHHVYPRWDLHSVVSACDYVPQLRKAWDGAMLVCDRHLPGGLAVASLGEGASAIVAAPLVDYFEYGRLVLTDEDILELRGVENPATRLLNPAPRVLVGSHQSAMVSHGVPFEALGAQPVAETAAVVSPLHMIWEAVEPLTGIAVTRTYTLGIGQLCSGHGLVEPLQVLLQAYATVAACCRYLLEEGGPLARAAFSPDREMELQQAAADFLSSSGVPMHWRLEVTCAAMDTMGMPCSPPDTGLTLIFVRVALTDIVCPGTGSALGSVAFGDSVFCARPSQFVSESYTAMCSLTTEVVRFGFWPPPEDAGAKETRSGLESCLGIGFDRGPSVLLGGRSGHVVYLEDRGPPPDPLGLGQAIDIEIRSAFAMDVSLRGVDMPRSVAGQVAGIAWTFATGKVVVQTPRTGHLLLQVEQLADQDRLPCEEGPAGLVWIPVQVCNPAEGGFASFRAAIAVPPGTAAQFRTLQPGDPSAQLPSSGNVDLTWVRSVGRQDQEAARIQPRMLPTIALTVGHGGQMSFLTCRNAFDEQAAQVAPVQPLKCVWVSGLPGSGAMDVAVALATALGAPLVDVATASGLGSSHECIDDVRVLGAPLANLLLATAQQTHNLIVACDVALNPIEVLSSLAEQSPFKDVCCITHVISVVHPLAAYPWSTARHPLMLSRAHRGWIDKVVVQDQRPADTVGPSGLEALSALLRHELEACRSSRHDVLQRPPTSALAADVLQPLPASRLQRLLALPDSAASAAFLQAQAKLCCVFIPTSVPLDVATLHACCAERLQAAAAASSIHATAAHENPWRGLFCIEAHVHGMVGSDLDALGPQDLLPTLQGHAAQVVHQMVLTPRGPVRVPQYRAAPLAASTGVLWWWCTSAGLAPEVVASYRLRLRQEAEAAVEACRLRPPGARHPWTVADVPAEQVAFEVRALLEAGPPDGCFFNGVGYIDVDGHESKDHPHLGACLEVVVANHNAEVQAWNAAIAQAATLPMFQH